jgi:dTDP-glucose 4,6-dehydratase
MTTDAGEQSPRVAGRPRHRPRRIVVTGGAGFIGSRLVHHLLDGDPSVEVVVLDIFTYAGNHANLAGAAAAHGERLHIERGDVADAEAAAHAVAGADTVVHLAAESHVDRAITDPVGFLETNVLGTQVMLAAANAAWRDRRDVRFVHVSTDEVYGSIAPGEQAAEDRRFAPGNPYAASKAAAEHLVGAWAVTHALPAVTVVLGNVYGPCQFPEKLIPRAIARAGRSEPIELYGDGGHQRTWLHADDACRAIDAVMRDAATGARYHAAGAGPVSNAAVIAALAAVLDTRSPSGAPHARLITHVADRPGHDRRYALDTAAIARDLVWAPRVSLAEGLDDTVRWYLGNQAWLEATRGRYRLERLGLV